MEYLQVVMPIGLIRVTENGGLLKGPIMNPFSTSSASSLSSMSDSDRAD